MRVLWCVAAGLALVRGQKTGTPDLHPIAGLAAKGIRSTQLDALFLGANDGDDNTCYCSLACETLAATFGDAQVSSVGQEAYGARLGRFWSAQQAQETKPRCFFHPFDAEDISVAILVSRATQCPFAVKGGGHAAFKGASNSDGGITIDFVNMVQVVPSADQKTVTIGPGNTWFDVYSTLEAYNLTMVGGRVASVGVGGLLLGGGISFFSGQHGWACDNIVSYEVVIASGEILHVDSANHPDLFWALRGGGGNFGVVTKFVANTFKQGLMWGGFIMYDMHSTKSATIDAMIAWAKRGGLEDPKSAMIVSFSYVQPYSAWMLATILDHAEPQEPGSHPEVFNDFFLGNAISDSTRTTSHSNLTMEIDSMSPFGSRQSYWMYSTYVDKQLTTDLVNILQEEVTPIADVPGLVASMSFQVIKGKQLQWMSGNGGNPLGVGNKPLLVANLAFSWVLQSDDKAVLKALNNIVTRAKSVSEERGLFHPFLYMNYASQWQDPIAGYGAENKGKLLKIAKKYDPEEVFQKLHPGYFKLHGSPAEWKEQ
ncbi:FAD-binding domain-containing protein [Biscogniauxia sp. FL1348]|nr:FAD-binding domain-containing protein [Biscogniauxia sp. FL1348]